MALLLLIAVSAAAAEPPELLLAQAIRHYRAGRLARAVPLLSEVVERAEHLVVAGHYLGLAQVRLGELARGRKTLVRTARRDPRNPRLLLDLGLAYLAEGNAAWAARTLREARTLDPLDSRIRYFLGVALLRLGHSDGAVAQLRAARHEEGMDWRTVRVQLGLAHYQAGRWSAAREMVGPVAGWRGRHGREAARLLRAAREAEGPAADWVDGQLSVGGVVDSNPLYEHERTASTAVGPGVAGSLILRPHVGSRAIVWGEVAGSRLFYFPAGSDEGGNAEDASRTDLRGSAFSRWFLGASGRLQLTTGYVFDLVFLDGKPPLADANHIFLERHGGHVALLGCSGDGTTLQLRYSLSRSEYAELPRSNWGNELGLEHYRSFWSGRGRLLAWLSLRHELANLADYDALVPSTGVGLSYLLPWDLMLGLRLGFEHRNHYRSGLEGGRWLIEQAESGRVVTKHRLDNTLGPMVEVGRALFWRLRLRAVYQWMRNFSTVEQFDYDRHLATLNLSWSTL